MSPSAEPKFAMYWSAACGGCEIAVLNIHEGILEVDANFDVVFWPVAMDYKYKDVEAMPDGSITLTLFNGAIRNDENEHIAKVLRQKSKVLVAFGACASEGGIPGLANLSSKQLVLDTVFNTIPTENGAHIRPLSNCAVPEGDLHLPHMCDTVKPLDQVTQVDYYMPGCPPESHQIVAVVGVVVQALQGKAELPPPGTIIGASHSTVCDECTRARREKAVTEFKRMATFQPNMQDCLLEQGILCSGIATRSGCTALCPKAGMPCIGCYGPAPSVVDQGARMLSAVASVVASKDAKEIDKVIDGIPDPVGTFYRFTLPHSLMKHGRMNDKG